MIDASSEARASRLHRIAAAEIARHREAQGFLGAALDGSLATGAVWPSSDVDFTVVPLRDASSEQLMEWEGREALAFLRPHPDGRMHIDVCGAREGVPCHKHITAEQAFVDVIEGYPESFIRPARGHFDAGANWFLDGLAVMQVVDDPEGLLGETRQFVAAHRFTPEVWEGRRSAFLEELRRQHAWAHEAMDRGEADGLYQRLCGNEAFAAVAAQLWLENAQQIYSSKEQDGRLAEAAAAAGCPEAHALYHRTLAVDPERARAAAPLLLRLGERTATLFQQIGTRPPEDPDRCRWAIVWGAYIVHLTGTLSLAPDRGHPARVYQELRFLSTWTEGYPDRHIAKLPEQDTPEVETLRRDAAALAGLTEQIRTLLLDPLHAVERTRHCLAAADSLLALTEQRL